MPPFAITSSLPTNHLSASGQVNSSRSLTCTPSKTAQDKFVPVSSKPRFGADRAEEPKNLPGGLEKNLPGIAKELKPETKAVVRRFIDNLRQKLQKKLAERKEQQTQKALTKEKKKQDKEKSKYIAGDSGEIIITNRNETQYKESAEDLTKL